MYPFSFVLVKLPVTLSWATLTSRMVRSLWKSRKTRRSAHGYAIDFTFSASSVIKTRLEFRRLPCQTSIHFHQFQSIPIHFNPFQSISIHFNPFQSLSININQCTGILLLLLLFFFLSSIIIAVVIIFIIYFFFFFFFFFFFCNLKSGGWLLDLDRNS